MGFFAPWFLVGRLAVWLPVWLHLLRKHRSPPQPFGSLMFWERHTQSSIKHRRLRYLLLLALRTALFFPVALAASIWPPPLSSSLASSAWRRRRARPAAFASLAWA